MSKTGAQAPTCSKQKTESDIRPSLSSSPITAKSAPGFLLAFSSSHNRGRREPARHFEFTVSWEQIDTILGSSLVERCISPSLDHVTCLGQWDTSKQWKRLLEPCLCIGTPPLLPLLEPSHHMKKTELAGSIGRHVARSFSIAPANQQTHE